MKSTVTEIAADIYRLCFYNEAIDFQFCQFLVADEQPMLIHTGMRSMFAATLEAVGKVISPRDLRWIGFSHVEADECGALNDWLLVAPEAQVVSGFVQAAVNLNDSASKVPKVLTDGSVLETGRRRLRYLSTPHVPHCWDAGLFFEETERTLFCSDLFLQNGNTAPLTESDIVGPARKSMSDNIRSEFGADIPFTPRTQPTLKRLADLNPANLAVMHGASFHGDCRQAIQDYSKVLNDLLADL